MTTGSPTAPGCRPRRASTDYPKASAAFAPIGWTTDDWDDLYEAIIDNPDNTPGTTATSHWLRHPPGEFRTSITPAMVLAMFARHGRETAQVLGAIADGASERFAVAFLNPSWRISNHRSATDGWQFASDLGLTETQATGWAATDYLGSLSYRYLPQDDDRWDKDQKAFMAALVQEWTARFGPDAYLYVLAGFTLDEAVAMRDKKTSPIGDQLRVMVALNGVVLPVGV